MLDQIDILRSLIFFLPAYIANMFPVLIKVVPSLKKLTCYPLDFGMNLWDKRIFGDNKTIIGTFSGVFFGTLVSFLIFSLFFVDFYEENLFFSVLVICFGAISGDLLKSFFKRRIGIPSGKHLIFFDQLDFIFGAWIMYSLFFGFTLEVFLILLIASLITPILHLTANIIAYYLRLKNVWW